MIAIIITLLIIHGYSKRQRMRNFQSERDSDLHVLQVARRVGRSSVDSSSLEPRRALSCTIFAD